MKPTRDSHSDLFLSVAELGYWFDKRQVQLWVFGTEWKRHRRTEILLRRMTQRKKKGLTAIRYGNKLIYTLRKRAKNLDPREVDPYHDLNCMECFVRFKRANPRGKALPPKSFKGCGSEPDGGFQYLSGDIIAFEWSSENNVAIHREVEGKLRAYDNNLERIEKRFVGRATVVFILEVEREYVKRKVAQWKPQGHYRFIDYLSFLDAENAFDAPYIYPDGSVGTL